MLDFLLVYMTPEKNGKKGRLDAKCRRGAGEHTTRDTFS
jgi:hypothetical protein